MPHGKSTKVPLVFHPKPFMVYFMMQLNEHMKNWEEFSNCLEKIMLNNVPRLLIEIPSESIWAAVVSPFIEKTTPIISSREGKEVRRKFSSS